MAAATRLLAKSGVCAAVLNFDDVSLLATGFTVANIGGVESITFFMVVNSQTLTAVVGIGQTKVTPFPSSVQCSVGTNSETGAPTFIMAGVTEYGIGSS